MSEHKMVSMERTKEEKKDRTEVLLSEIPNFPHGLTVHLDEDSLKKLGIEELPKVGDEGRLNARVTIKSVSEEETGEGPDRSVTLQITHMELLEPEKEKEGSSHTRAADKLFGGK